MSRETLVLILFLGIISVVTAHNGKSFNRFKSYRDAKHKPIHYGKKPKINHPIHEYLSDIQKDMYKIRRSSTNKQEHMFDHKWTGFHDKSQAVRERDNRRLDDIMLQRQPLNRTRKVKPQLRNRGIVEEEDTKITGSDYLRWIFFLFVTGSIGWIFYLFENRKHVVRRATLQARGSLSEEIRNDIEAHSTSSAGSGITGNVAVRNI